MYLEEYLNLGDVEVFHRCWVPDRVDVLVVGVHGFAEHGGRYTHVGEAFLENGYAFCIHDLRGHGRTARGEDIGYVEKFDYFVKDLEKYVEIMVGRYRPRKTVLLGHSMGGLIVLHYLARVSRNVDAAVTSGAATLIKIGVGQMLMLRFLNMFNPRARVDLPIKPELLSHNLEIVKKYVEDPLVFKKPTIKLLYELANAAKSIWRYIDRVDKPILVLHGEKDSIVPPQASIEVYNRVRNTVKELKIYKDLYHEILNEFQWREVLNDIVNWIQKVVK